MAVVWPMGECDECDCHQSQYHRSPTISRGLKEENTQLGIISPIGYFKSPIGYIFQLGIGDLLSDSALPDSHIPNTQSDILYPMDI